MDFNSMLSRMLTHARSFTEGVLAEFKSPHDWMVRMCEGGNHAIWIVGHLAAADNAFIGFVRPESKIDFSAYGKLFGRGSVPVDDASVYPASDDLLQIMRERRATMLQVLQSCTADDFARPVPAGAPPFMTDVAAVFQGAVWHEALHSGQLSVIHRALGNQPIAGRPAA